MTAFEPFDSVDMSSLTSEAELDFQFENDKVLGFYKKLMACVCSICGFTASNMSALNRHTTNEHRLSFCDLCLRHAHMLPSEFVPLSSKDLAAHRRWDSVKKRGHPVCKFCAQTFYEFENLVVHIREAHFICDFCHTAGVFEVFRRQQELFSHYKEMHFVCPECESAGRMACFVSEEQLGIHRMREHPNESRNDPSLWEPLQILYSNQGLIGQHTRDRNSGRRGLNAPNEDGGEADGLVVFYPAQPRAPMPEEWTVTDFPSLTGERAANNNDAGNEASTETQRTTSAVAGRQTRSHAEVVSGRGGGSYANSHNLNDFPSLPSSSSGNTSANQPPSQPKWVDTKRSASAAVSSKSDGQKIASKSVPNVDDFPSLVGSSTSANHISPGNWAPAQIKVTPKPKDARRQPIADDFPPLSPTASTSSTSQRALPESCLPSCVPSTSKQAEKTKNKKVKSKAVEPSLPPAPDLEPFSSVLLKAKKSSWWNNADNDGAVSRMVKGEDGAGGRMAEPIYSRVQTVDHFDPIDTASTSVIPPPPNFSPQDFPSLGGDVKPSKKNAFPTTSKKPPELKKERRKSTPDPQLPQATSTNSKKKDVNVNQNQASSEEIKSLPDLEDTETVLYEKNIYTPPLDYEAKNREVITIAETVLSGEGYSKNAFNRFATLSRLFRHGQLSAHSYLEALESLLTCKGELLQTDWLSSMIALLPDVGLQRALFRAMKGEAAPRVPHVSTPSRCRGNNPPVWAKGVVAALQVCSVCGQVCRRSGMREHTELAHS
ncbi:Zinc finger protein 598 [Echinococcus granulosus]|uniref:Zinc finger protein 598 n=1 Tax=Echinococcus granulosus TaxID=6210 RepID=W6V5V6_ECHGR|nr:Zinc finger protein 598 [Echinococcus granulosus]EUB61749.1 Zinc finger protein 598 [Echinococcus granulosus]